MKELLHFAYLAQCRCDPPSTLEYFQALTNIVDASRVVLQCPSSLVETPIVAEKSCERFTSDDVYAVIRELDFDANNDLRVDYDEGVDEHFSQSAWRDAIRRSWRDTEGASKRRDA